MVVKNLIDIRSSGNVSGNVKYGKLALEMGGNLSAEMRNVPPSLGGDLNLEVAKGHSVPITLQDLTALDPDDAARDLGSRSPGRTTASSPSPVRPSGPSPSSPRPTWKRAAWPSCTTARHGGRAGFDIQWPIAAAPRRAHRAP